MEIRLLGPFEALRDDEPLPGLTGRVRTLLAVLALAVPDSVSVDAIGQRLWGDDPPANLRPSVHTSIARLRTLLAPNVSVDTTPGGYALRVDPQQVDALAFTQLLEQAAQATDPAAERDLLTAALDLWRGEPFGGIRSDWLEREQAPRLTEAYLSATERRIDLDLAAGRHDVVLPPLRELTAKHPLRESLWLRLLTALSRSGRPAEALTLYDELRRRLADELGVDPEAELRGLHAELLEATEPKRPTQATTTRSAPRQLPPAPARFTGRTAALNRLDTLSGISSGSAGGSGSPDGSGGARSTGRGSDTAHSSADPRPLAILAVHGQGGVGKTSLALHWAHRVADQFPDGQLYLNLQGYGPGDPMDPDTALDLLLRGLGVSGNQIPERGPARTAMLRTVLADRRVLLLLDNARDAEQVRPLLPGSGCLVLITSRSQLRSLAAREGAHRVALDRFGADDAAAYLTATFEPHHVQASATEIAELSELCGHLPLALAIAAERVTREPAAGVRALITELRDHPDRLGVLDVDEDDDGALRVVFDWSYRVLAPPHARMFRLLALQPAQDLGLGAAAALAGTSEHEAARCLDGLTSAHLLEQPGHRYQLHDLLRLYSNTLIQQTEEPVEREAARARLLDWYAHTARSGKAMLERSQPLLDFGSPLPGVTPLTFEDTPAAAGWFTSERHVLIAAVHDAVRHGHDQAAYRIAFGLWPYLIYLRALDDLFELQRVGLEAARRTGDLLGEAALAQGLGMAFIQQNDYQKSSEQLTHSLKLFDSIGHARGSAGVLTDLGRLFRYSGDLKASVQSHLQAIEALDPNDEPVETARNLANLAETYLSDGRPEEAAEAAARAVHLNRASGERRAEAFALNTLATAHLSRGDHATAVGHYQESLAISQALSDRWAEARAEANLGDAFQQSANLPQARTHWRRALDILTQANLPGTPALNREKLQALLTS
ncbi:AfsR/SARP family transcriptional regulator [Kribbella lupini]|uniref:BTAD domain-containing putative transcriptional regulator n=1 Tax=Kribbella lupini TaxID=291602 RepID=A0ABP4L4U1_9ACTN